MQAIVFADLRRQAHSMNLNIDVKEDYNKFLQHVENLLKNAYEISQKHEYLGKVATLMHLNQLINLKTFRNEMSEIHPNPICQKMVDHVEKAKTKNLDLFQRGDFDQYVKTFNGDKGPLNYFGSLFHCIKYSQPTELVKLLTNDVKPDIETKLPSSPRSETRPTETKNYVNLDIGINDDNDPQIYAKYGRFSGSLNNPTTKR